MNNHKRTIYLFSAVFLMLAATSLFGADAHMMEIRIEGIESAGPPQYLNRQVLLSYQTNRPVRLVGARFAHEEYRIFHTYFRNRHGVFLLLLDVPEKVEELHYRIVVDGLWINDPFNPRQREDSFGRRFSVFSLDDRPAPPVMSPEFDSTGQVTFLFRTLPGRAVSVAGDFNNWNPFWDRLEEREAGTYTLTLRIPPGRHFYYYVVNGQRVLDPINPDTARDFEDHRVSTFLLSEADRSTP